MLSWLFTQCDRDVELGLSTNRNREQNEDIAFAMPQHLIYIFHLNKQNETLNGEAMLKAYEKKNSVRSLHDGDGRAHALNTLPPILFFIYRIPQKWH